MFEIFESYIRANGDFTNEDVKLMRSLAIVRKVRRKDILLQEGEVCKQKIFVAKGLLKAYLLNDDGAEHIMRFSPENNWATDGESLMKQTPSKYNIEALEPSELVILTREALGKLHAAVPAFKLYTDKLIEKALHSVHQRMAMTLSYTTEEKYEDFITSFPDVFGRVPLHMVASYLGVSRETLSRIRHAQLKQ